MGLNETLQHPITGLAAIGLLGSGRVVWPVLGGSGEDEDAEITVEDDTAQEDAADDADSGADAEEGEKPKAEDEKVSRLELKKATAARDAAKRDLRDARNEITALKRAGQDETARAISEAVEAATAATEKKLKPLVIRTSARAELIAAGVKDEKVARLVKLLNLDEIEIDDDGEVAGLTDQVDALKEEWPELFADPAESKPEPRRGSRAADGADRKPEPKRQLTVTERQAAILTGRTS